MIESARLNFLTPPSQTFLLVPALLIISWRADTTNNMSIFAEVKWKNISMKFYISKHYDWLMLVYKVEIDLYFYKISHRYDI